MLVDVLLGDGARGPAGYPAEVREYRTPPAEPPPGWSRMTTADLAALQAAMEPERQAWLAAQPAPPQSRVTRVVTALAFRRRLPFARRVELTALAAEHATLRAWLDDQIAASVIDLDDAETVGAIDTLRAQHVLDEADVAALLADPRPEEAP